MALIVNGVCRFAFNGTYLDRPWVNICDMQIDTTGSLADRDDAIFDTAGNLINSWVEHIASRASDEMTLDSVSWTDLDAEDGSTGSRTTTSQHTLPVAGASTQDTAAGNLAILVRKAARSSRSSRPGRWYQCGLVESGTAGNELTPLALSGWQTIFDDFLVEINDEPDPNTYTRSMVVVHTTAEDPKFGTFTVVEALSVAPRLATQRRRLRG